MQMSAPPPSPPPPPLQTKNPYPFYLILRNHLKLHWFLISTVDVGVRPDSCTFYHNKICHVHCIGVPIGPRASLKAVAKSKIRTFVVQSVFKAFFYRSFVMRHLIDLCLSRKAFGQLQFIWMISIEIFMLANICIANFQCLAISVTDPSGRAV